MNETVNFVAWEPGKGIVGQMRFVAAFTANAVTNAWFSENHQSAFQHPPMVLADMQTTANTDTAALRTQQIGVSSFLVKVEEEQSKDSEVTHPAETVGYLAISQEEEKVLATFTWEFDSAQEATINGFAILENGTAICSIDSPTARTANCTISKPTGATAFSIQALASTGEKSTPSNSLTYAP